MKRKWRSTEASPIYLLAMLICFVGIERNTKLVLAWHLGDRDVQSTEAFTEKLDHATSGRFQLTTDGFQLYPQAVSYLLGVRVEYATRAPREGEEKYSPPEWWKQ